MNELELAWAAGFFDGEGTVVFWSNGRQDAAIRASVAQSGPWGKKILLRSRRAVGNIGTIYGPYQQQERQTPYYRLDVGRREEVLQPRDLLWPYLSPVKRAQFKRAENKRREVHDDV